MMGSVNVRLLCSFAILSVRAYMRLRVPRFALGMYYHALRLPGPYPPDHSIHLSIAVCYLHGSGHKFSVIKRNLFVPRIFGALGAYAQARTGVTSLFPFQTRNTAASSAAVSGGSGLDNVIGSTSVHDDGA